MRRFTSLLAGTAVFLLATGSAAAQVLCGNHADIVGLLEKDFAETRAAYGLSETGRLIEVFVSPQGTWTILVTAPPGPTCVIEFGRTWEAIPPLPVARGPMA